MAAAALTVVLVGCDGGGAGTQRGQPVDTVVPGPRGAVDHVIPRDSCFGVHGDYSIYLPPGYGHDSRRRYPVVYLLHGGSDSDSFFLELGVREAMDAALAAGTVEPMILVLPDAGPKFDGDGTVATSFSDYVADELVPEVDGRWLTLPERAGRAIGGISLGGRHALEFAAEHPALVAAAGGHSTTVPHSPADLAAAGIPIYLDDGVSDGLFDDDKALAEELSRRGADVEWHPAEGGHDRSYWTAHLADYLRFYSGALGAG
jgi:enterochelin esterase-like enzyme